MPLKYAYSLKTEPMLREYMHNFEVRFAIVLLCEVNFKEKRALAALFSLTRTIGSQSLPATAPSVRCSPPLAVAGRLPDLCGAKRRAAVPRGASGRAAKDANRVTPDTAKGVGVCLLR